MLDPRFKGLECVSKLVGVVSNWELVKEYAKRVILPLLVKVNKHLNAQSIEILLCVLMPKFY